MPNLIKSASTISNGSVKKNNFLVATDSSFSYAPTSITDFWVGITPPLNGYTVYAQKESQGPSIRVASTDSELITISKQYGGTNINTIYDALSYFNSQPQYMVVNIDYESIITSGLTLSLDAGYLPSYSRTGNTINDISGNGYIGTLTNGPTFSGSNNGSIVFDGTNDFALVNNPSNIRNQNFTVSVWINPGIQNAATISIIDFDHSASPLQGWVMQSEDALTNKYFYFAWYDGSSFQPSGGGGFGAGKGIQITSEIWQNITYSKNGTTLLGYKNGIQTYTGTSGNSNVNYASNRNLQIGGCVSTAGRNFKGNISNALIYNRTLSSTEVLQNYNAQKGRFISTPLSLGSTPLLLDTYSGSSAAYSLRKLSSTYSGSAIRVRRSSDNTEKDIGFVSNQLDTTALLDFVNGENYLLYSQDFTQNSWTKTSVTVTSSSGTAPDGTNTAQKCVPSAAVTIKAIYQTLQSVSTRDYVFSMYAKASEYNYMQLLAIRDSSNRYSIIVDLTTGLITQTNTVGTPNFINSSVTSVGNGWYRIVITLNINLGVNYFVFSPSPVANPTLDAELNMLNAGNGTSGVLFWGSQLNYISLKPYIGTTTSFVTPTTTNGFVTTWYDQSGNGRNVTQTTAGNQPYIVGSGVLNLSNGKPAIFFTRTENDRLTTSGIITGNISRTQIAVYQPTAGHSALAGGVWGQASNTVNGTWSAIQSRSTTGAIGDPYFAGYSRDLGNGLTTETTLMKIASFSYNGTTGYLWKNNTQLTSGSLTLNTAIGDLTQIGSTGGGSAVLEPLQGNISECILYLTNQLSNISAINTNINSHYSIY